MEPIGSLQETHGDEKPVEQPGTGAQDSESTPSAQLLQALKDTT